MNVGTVANDVLTKPSSTTSSGSAPGATKDSPKETFIRLLVTQLEHQNPLEPMDNAEFTAQLAQFTSLEQLQAMNANLSALMSAQTTANSLQATNLIGKEVQAQSNTTRVQKDGSATPLHYTLAKDSATVQIGVVDAAGNTVRTLEPRNQKTGPQNVTWNGKDAQGKPLPEGEYHFSVTALDKAGNPVAVEASLKGTVESVAYEGTQPYLVVGGNRVQLNEITNITQSK